MHRACFTAVVLVLSVLACSIQVPTTPTTVLTTPVLTVVKPSTTPDNTPEPQTAIVKAAAINVRQKPDGEVIAVLNAGNTVAIVQCRGNWCQISKPVEGWLWKGCLRGLAGGLGCQAR